MWKILVFVLLPASFVLTGCPVEPSDAESETPQQNSPNQAGGPLDQSQATPPTTGEGGAVAQPYSGQTFKELIKSDDESIELAISITGAPSFDMEFQICQESAGRKQPSVIHKQRVDSASVAIKVPKNYDKDVWLVLRYHENDEPGPNSLEAGLTEPLKFGEENLSLRFTLSKEKVEEKNPCYSQDQEENQQQ